jgi:hypothetical protein
MFRKSVPLMILAVFVIGSVLVGATLTSRPTNAQDANMNFKALIQSYVDQGQAFTINTRATNFVVDGETVQISQLGDDFLCVTGELNVMGNPMQTICSTFDSMIVLIP